MFQWIMWWCNVSICLWWPVQPRLWPSRCMRLPAESLCKRCRLVRTIWPVASNAVTVACSNTMAPSNRYSSPCGTILLLRRCKTSASHPEFLHIPLVEKVWAWVHMLSRAQMRKQMHIWRHGASAFLIPFWYLDRCCCCCWCCGGGGGSSGGGVRHLLVVLSIWHICIYYTFGICTVTLWCQYAHPVVHVSTWTYQYRAHKHALAILDTLRANFIVLHRTREIILRGLEG